MSFFGGGGVTKSGASLLKKSVHDLLFLAHKFLALLQAVRLALDVDDGAVMQDTVQDGGGDGDVGKNLVPLGEGLVGGKDGRRLLIPPGNELEEQVSALDVHGEITNLISFSLTRFNPLWHNSFTEFLARFFYNT